MNQKQLIMVSIFVGVLTLIVILALAPDAPTKGDLQYVAGFVGGVGLTYLLLKGKKK